MNRRGSKMSISIQWEPRGFVLKVHKEVDFDELSARYSELVTDPRYGNCQYSLLDASDVKFVGMDLDKLQHVANTFLAVGKKHTEQYKFALVFNEGALEEEVEHYLSLIAQASIQVNVFHSLAEARQWLEEQCLLH